MAEATASDEPVFVDVGTGAEYPYESMSVLKEVLSASEPPPEVKNVSKKLPFTISERELIVALVKERPVIEDRRTHAQNIELKKKAWAELTALYNAKSFVTPRKSIQLKRCWENIKTQRKKERSQASMSRFEDQQDSGTVSSDNIEDAIYPIINLTVPGVVDSNSTEDSDCLKQCTVVQINKKETRDNVDLEMVNDKPADKSFNTKHFINFYDSETCGEVMNVDSNFMSEIDENLASRPKKRKEISTTSSGIKKLASEIETRTKRSSMSMQQDSELHELRLKREMLLIKREENLIEYEKQLHRLQLEKLKIELQLLRNKLEN